MPRLALRSVLLAVIALAAASGDAHAHAPGVLLYAAGTASVDGVVRSGEWDRAARVSFQANRPAFDGGGTATVTLLEMNDGGTLYLAVQVARPLTGTTSLGFDFDNRHKNYLELGDDAIVTNTDPFFPPTFFDNFHLSPVSGSRSDVDDGGTNDGAVATSGVGGVTTFELAHPLDSADDRHDFSLSRGARIGFRVFVRLWSNTPACNEGPQCYADTSFPGPTANEFGDLVVAPDVVPPETTIVGGQRQGSRVRTRTATFSFRGEDNLSPPEKLAFSCALDGAAFAPCTTPVRLRNLRVGRHTFSVRAKDELGNEDPTAARRSWSVIRRR